MSNAPKLIACVLLPRFELTVAAGVRTDLLGVPAAVAPEPGARLIGAVSAAAEAFGIAPGMALGEALARCRELTLIPPDPAGVADAFERMLEALESIGAAVEPLAPGLACFDAGALLGLYGSGHASGPGRGQRATTGQQRLVSARPDASVAQRLDPTRPTVAGRADEPVLAVLRAARRALGVPARFGVAPSRFAAVAAARGARARQPSIVTGGTAQARGLLAPLPVELLLDVPGLEWLPEALARLGVRTLGELAALPRAAVADRFGRPGLSARRLASGEDTPLRPRQPGESLHESLDLPEASSGAQLGRALELLIARLLARRERRGRTLRAVVLGAVLVEHGGSWRQQVSFREATGDPVRMGLALEPRLAMLPAPAQTLTLTATRFGSPARDQQALLREPARARAQRLREAVRQARAAAGPDAALRVLEIDPGSRFPERRNVLAPFEP